MDLSIYARSEVFSSSRALGQVRVSERHLSHSDGQNEVLFFASDDQQMLPCQRVVEMSPGLVRIWDWSEVTDPAARGLMSLAHAHLMQHQSLLTVSRASYPETYLLALDTAVGDDLKLTAPRLYLAGTSDLLAPR